MKSESFNFKLRSPSEDKGLSDKERHYRATKNKIIWDMSKIRLWVASKLEDEVLRADMIGVASRYPNNALDFFVKNFDRILKDLREKKAKENQKELNKSTEMTPIEDFLNFVGGNEDEKDPS